MNFRHCSLAFVLTACAVLAGCATSRSEVKLGTPDGPAAATNASGKLVAIRSVKDERAFQQAPSDPSIPSLGFEGAAAATAQTKARAIARKRNGFGQALGDVLLEPGQSVEAVVRDNLAAALRQAGFRVAGPADSNAAALQLDVRVSRFWAWMKPGFWALTASANIDTEISASSQTAAIPIRVQYQDSRQFMPESAWIEVIDKALAAYREDAARQLGALK